MANETEIRNDIKNAKKPQTKMYIAALIIAGLVLVVYIMLYSGITVQTTGVVESINTPSQAQSAVTNVGSGVQSVAADIDAISDILGG